VSVDPFFNDRATIGVFGRAFSAGRAAAEAIRAWRAHPRAFSTSAAMPASPRSRGRGGTSMWSVPLSIAVALGSWK
jgi:hypothetical protein